MDSYTSMGDALTARESSSGSVSSDDRRSRSYISQSHSTPNFGKGNADTLKGSKTLIKGDYMPKELQNWENRSSSWKSRQLKLAFLNKKQTNRVSRLNSTEGVFPETASTKSFDGGDLFTRSVVPYSHSHSKSSLSDTGKFISRNTSNEVPMPLSFFAKRTSISAHRGKNQTFNCGNTCQFFNQYNLSSVPKSKSLHSIRNKDDEFNFSSFATRFSIARETDL